MIFRSFRHASTRKKQSNTRGMSASNVMFQNMAANINTSANSMVQTTSFMSKKIWIGVGIAILVLALVAVAQQTTFWRDILTKLGYGSSIGSIGSIVPTGPTGTTGQVPLLNITTDDYEHKDGKEMQVEKPRSIRETWCFVGEDLTGRFCVKVPSENSCDRDRSFGSRSDCEMTAASHMPAGVITSGGIGILPLSAKKL